MNRRLLLLPASLLVAVSGLAACGGDDADVPAATGSSATRPAGTASPTGTAAASPTAKGTPIKLDNPTVTASGLQYVDTVVGKGASPTLDQSVTVNYTGRLAATGEVFDSTEGKGPVTFGMQRVIKGFQEGLSTMKVGGKRTVYIPSALGYGPQGFPPKIPANADLVFDIELIAVK